MRRLALVLIVLLLLAASVAVADPGFLAAGWYQFESTPELEFTGTWSEVVIDSWQTLMRTTTSGDTVQFSTGAHSIVLVYRSALIAGSSEICFDDGDDETCETIVTNAPLGMRVVSYLFPPGGGMVTITNTSGRLELDYMMLWSLPGEGEPGPGPCEDCGEVTQITVVPPPDPSSTWQQVGDQIVRVDYTLSGGELLTHSLLAVLIVLNFAGLVLDLWSNRK